MNYASFAHFQSEKMYLSGTIVIYYFEPHQIVNVVNVSHDNGYMYNYTLKKLTPEERLIWEITNS